MLEMNVSYGEKRKEFRNVNYLRLKPLEMSKKRKKPKTGHYPLPLSPYTRGGAYKLTGKLVVFGVCRWLDVGTGPSASVVSRLVGFCVSISEKTIRRIELKFCTQLCIHFL